MLLDAEGKKNERSHQKLSPAGKRRTVGVQSENSS